MALERAALANMESLLEEDSSVAANKAAGSAAASAAEGDRAAWRMRTPEERLDAVEVLRVQAGKFLYEYPTRLRRLLTVVRRPSR